MSMCLITAASLFDVLTRGKQISGTIKVMCLAFKCYYLIVSATLLLKSLHLELTFITYTFNTLSVIKQRSLFARAGRVAFLKAPSVIFSPSILLSSYHCPGHYGWGGGSKEACMVKWEGPRIWNLYRRRRGPQFAIRCLCEIAVLAVKWRCF